MTLLTLPAYYAAWLPPDTSKLVELIVLFCLVFTLSLSISRIAGGPFVAFGWLSWALGTSDVAARVAGSSCGRNEEGIALVAGASDSLRRRLVCPLVARPGGDGQDFLLLGLLNSLFLDALLSGRLLLGVSGALLAALVLALQAHFVVSIESTTAVAAAVDAHTDGLLDTRHQRSGSRGSNPLMGLEGQSVFGEQRTGTLLLHGIAVEDWGVDDGRRGLGAGSGDYVVGGSRTVIHMISNRA